MSQPENIKKSKGIKFSQMLKDYSLNQLLFAPIEIAKNHHEASFVNYYGDIVSPHFPFPNNRQGVEQYLTKLNKAAKNTQAKKIIIGLESSGHYHENLMLSLENEGYDVILINPFEVWKERDSISRKTDPIDLNSIASVLIHNRGSVTKLKRDIQYKLLRATRTRRKFVQQRSTFKVIIRSLVDRIFPGLQDNDNPVFSDFWGKASILVLEKYPAPQDIISLGENRLANFLIKNNTKLGLSTAKRLVALAKNSLSRDYNDLNIDILVLKKYIHLFKELNDFIEILQQHIASLLIQTPGIFLLSIPGISLIYASEFMAEIGSPNYYQHYRQILDLAGASSKIHQSGSYEAKGLPISGRGNKFLRTVINQIGNALKSKGKTGSPYFAQFAQRLLDRGKHPRCVNFAVGSKFTSVSLSMLKSESFFRPPTVRDHLNLNDKDFMISSYYTVVKKLSNFSSQLSATEENYLIKIKKSIESKFNVKLENSI